MTPTTTWHTCVEANQEERFAQGQLSGQGQDTYQSIGNPQRKPWSDPSFPSEDAGGEAPRPAA